MVTELIKLFPTTIYHAVDQTLISIVESWFEDITKLNWLNELRTESLENNFQTTLVKYDKQKVDTLVDFGDKPEAKFFLDRVANHALEFLKQQGYSDHYHPFITSMWINEMKSGSEHLPHAHEGCFLAGTYYTRIPDDSPPLRFHSMLHDRFPIHVPQVVTEMEYNEIRHDIYPRPGSLVLWPAYIKHSVPKKDFTGLRRSMAFNLVIAE